MKITTSQLRRIIREEVEQEKLRRTIRESIRQELVREGFFDRVKDVFGAGVMKDFPKLLAGVRTLTSTAATHGPNLENPQYASDFLGKAIHESEFGVVNVPGNKGKGFVLSKIFDDQGNLIDKDLNKKLLDLGKQYENKKLDREKFERKVYDLVGIVTTRWSEFADFAKDLVAACKAKADKQKKDSDDAYEQGQKEKAARSAEDRDLRMKVARKLGLDQDDPRVDQEMNRIRGRVDRPWTEA